MRRRAARFVSPTRPMMPAIAQIRRPRRVCGFCNSRTYIDAPPCSNHRIPQTYKNMDFFLDNSCLGLALSSMAATLTYIRRLIKAFRWLWHSKEIRNKPPKAGHPFKEEHRGVHFEKRFMHRPQMPISAELMCIKENILSSRSNLVFFSEFDQIRRVFGRG